VETLHPGTYQVAAPCPRCGSVELVGVTISTVVTLTEEGGTLRVKLKGKGHDHDCTQATLPLEFGPPLEVGST
jgi:hypothetical protein